MTPTADAETEKVLRRIGGEDLSGSGFEFEEDESRQFPNARRITGEPDAPSQPKTGQLA